MPIRQHHGLMAAIAAFAAGAALLVVALHHQLGAVLGPPFETLATGAPLFGMCVGALVLLAVPGFGRPPSLLAHLANLVGLAAFGELAALLVLIHVQPFTPGGPISFPWIALVFGASALPFAAVGAALSRVVRYGRDTAVPITASILGGSGVGLVLAVVLGPVAGCFRLSLVAGIIFGVSALLLYGASRLAHDPAIAPVPERRPHGSTVAAIALAATTVFAGDLSVPWLKIGKTRYANLDRSEYVRSTDLGLVSVDRASGGVTLVHTDGVWTNPVLDSRTNLAPLPDEISGTLPHSGPTATLIIGPGASRTVRVARKYGHQGIHIVEPDTVVLAELVHDRHRKLTQELFEAPDVTFHVSSPRSFLARSSLLFDQIFVSLPDLSAALPSGSLELIEDDLFTVEGFVDLLRHLSPEGNLVVTAPEILSAKLIGLAKRAHRRIDDRGSDTPFGCSTGHVVSLLVRQSPLTATQVASLHRMCQLHRFTEVVSPDHEVDASLGAPVPSDERPFLYAPLLSRATSDAPKVWSSAHLGLLIAGSLFLLGLALLPLTALQSRSSPRDPDAGRGAPILFFSTVAMGTTFLVIGLRPGLTRFLGHPSHSLTTVAVGFLFAAAIACSLSMSTPLARARRLGTRIGQVTVAAAILGSASMGIILPRLASAPYPARVVFAGALIVVFIAPLGALVGQALRMVADPRSTASSVAIAAAGALLASGLGALLAIQVGFSAVVLVSSAFLLVAVLTVPALPSAARELASPRSCSELALPRRPAVPREARPRP